MAITFTANTAVLTMASAATYRFNENTAGSLVFGTYTGLDQAATYSFDALGSHPNIASYFTLVSRTLQDGTKVLDLVSIANANFDFETLSTIQATIRSSGSSSTTTLSLNLNLLNVNEAPTDLKIVPTGSSTQEDGVTVQETLSPNGAASAIVLGRLVSIDPDKTAGFGPNSARFTIDPVDPRADLYEIVADTENGGYLLRIKQGAIIDYDALPAGQKWHDLKIIIRDANGNGNSIIETIRINITNNTNDDPVSNPAPANVRFQTTGVDSITIDENTTAVGQVTATDNDTLTYSLATTDNPNASLFDITSGGILTLKAGVDYEALGTNKYYEIAVMVSDGTNPAVRHVLRVNIANVNEAPGALNFQTTGTDSITIDENTTAVGRLVGLDPEGAGLTYSFATSNNPHASLFNLSGGVLSLKAGVDYETMGAQKYYDVLISVSDGVNTVTRTVRVNIADIFENTAPTIAVTGQTTFTATDTGSTATPFGGVDLADGPEDDELTVTISFAAGDGALLFPAGANETVTTTSGTKNYTLKGKASVLELILANVRFDPTDVPNANSQSIKDTVFTIRVSDAAHPTPVSNDQIKVTTTITDKTVPNDAPTLTVEAGKESTNATDTGPSVNPFTGVIFFDSENDSLTVKISFASGEGDLEIPSGWTSNPVVSAGTKTYTFIGTHAQLTTLMDNLKFNPTDSTLSSGTVTTAFTISVRDNTHAEVTNQAIRVVTTIVDKTPPNQAPTLDVTATQFTANDTGSVAFPFSGIDLGDTENDTLTLKISFAAADGDLVLPNGVAAQVDTITGTKTYTFTGRADNLELILKNVAFNPKDVPNATSQSTVTTDFLVSVRDATHQPVINNQIKVVTTITDKTTTNTAPEDLSISKDNVNEGSGGGTLIGTLTGTDDDPGDVLTYEIISDPDGKFQIANGNQLQVRAGAVLDYETKTSHEVVIRVKDLAGAIYEEKLTIRVNDIVEAVPNRGPKDLGLSNLNVQELTKSGTSVATLSATDADGDKLTYKILVNGVAVDTDGYFTVSGNQLLIANSVSFDFEQIKSRPITLQATDGRGGTTQQTFTFNISDVGREIMTAGDASPFNDIIKGSKTGNFKDVFYGGAGDDKLWGGYGNDTLWGGTGRDVFVFDGKLGTTKTDRKVNFDTIKDYSIKDDSIWLENDLFKSNKELYKAIKKGTENKPVKLASKFFTVGDKAKDQNDYFIYDSKKRVLSYDSDGNGSKDAIEIATFTNNKALKNFNYKELFFI